MFGPPELYAIAIKAIIPKIRSGFQAVDGF